jgi:hypothetical protein
MLRRFGSPGESLRHAILMRELHAELMYDSDDHLMLELEEMIEDTMRLTRFRPIELEDKPRSRCSRFRSFLWWALHWFVFLWWESVVFRLNQFGLLHW